MLLTNGHNIIKSQKGVSMLKKIITLLMLVNISMPAQEEMLANYISIGLKNNLALQQKQFALQKSIATLDEARGMFLPSISLNARFTKAGGGRIIEFPVGDLFNPIHQTLNGLMGYNAFPTNLENEVIPFLREQEHDTRVSLVQPLFQPAIYYNYQIKENLSEIEKAEVDVYIRALIADIKIAYYQYLIAYNFVDLAKSTDEIVRENLRVSQSLYNNQKVTIDVVYRSQAEVSKVEQSIADANKQIDLARAYFNFLLNRELDAEIEASQITIAKEELQISLEDAEISALKNREELKQLGLAVSIADNSLSMSKSKYLPGIVFAADYGFEGEKYSFTKDDDFWTASVVLQWNIFNGMQDNAKIEQAELEKKKIEAEQREFENKIRLQVRDAYKSVMVSLESLDAAYDQLQSSKKTFEIIEKKYREGISSQIEFIDARTTMTRSEINNILTSFDYKIKLVELERITASGLKN